MRARTLLLTFPLALALLPFSLLAADFSPQDLVDQVVAAHGGKDAIAKAGSFRMEGRVIDQTRKAEGGLIRLFARPNRLRVTVDYPAGDEVRILDGDRGYRTDARGTLVEVSGFLLQSMALQAARSDLPYLLSSRRSEVRPTVPHTEDGAIFPGLELTLAPGMLVRAYVDPKSRLIIRSQAILNADPMRTHFETDYSDYRKVDGVMFPYHEENFASGVKTGTTVIGKVEVNPAISPAAFAPR